MSELCSYENLQRLFDGDILVGFLKEKHYEVKVKKNAKCEMLVERVKKAWASYLKFQENHNDENLYAFLHDFREFAYDRTIEIVNSDVPCYDIGFVSLMSKKPRLGRKVFAKLMENNINAVPMAELYEQIMLKTDSPFFEFERLY